VSVINKKKQQFRQAVQYRVDLMAVKEKHEIAMSNFSHQPKMILWRIPSDP
jgi:hypothetical protein